MWNVIKCLNGSEIRSDFIMIEERNLNNNKGIFIWSYDVYIKMELVLILFLFNGLLWKYIVVIVNFILNLNELKG